MTDMGLFKLFHNLIKPSESAFVEPNYTRFRAARIDEETIYYLNKIGLLDKAEILFKVRIAMPRRKRPVTIELPGASRSNDALSRLRELNFLDDNLDYRFRDWPQAVPIISSRYHHVSACVCELPDHIYHIEEYDFRDMQELYGCPNIYELMNHVPKKSIEVIDYD